MTFDERIAAERRKQEATGYTAEHDDGHDQLDWSRFLLHEVGGYMATPWAIEQQAALVKVAAVALAAYEALERKP